MVHVSEPRLRQGARSPLVDPRVETVVAWAQRPEEYLDDRASAAIDALTDVLPAPDTAPALALAAAAAYARVPRRGPRDLHAGHRLVALLGRMGEPGARELVRLRERNRYHHPHRAIERALAQLEHELGVPLEELEDAFGGPAVQADLTLPLTVGPYQALVRVGDDLRRVHTSWIGSSGRPVRSRPARTVDYPYELELVRAERRRLQSHLADLRARLEQAMASGRSWSVEEWVGRMFADPLRAALARRLVWRFDTANSSLIALPEEDGLHNVLGERVEIPRDANVELWHPAQNHELQPAWQRRIMKLGLSPTDRPGFARGQPGRPGGEVLEHRPGRPRQPAGTPRIPHAPRLVHPLHRPLRPLSRSEAQPGTRRSRRRPPPQGRHG